VTPAKVGRLNLGPMRQAAVTAVIVGIKPLIAAIVA
jgi:predicted RecB family endonuclease